MARKMSKDPVTGLPITANSYYRIYIEGKEPEIVRILARGNGIYNVVVFYDGRILASGSLAECKNYVAKGRKGKWQQVSIQD